ncbi:hypothetical protein OU798_18940 [Prolixibacteraceae bacterium Z1-6]|uniref:Uncharacterized protein n=1 Tax=Draconibacterium aestuarii TaxID=2998507 RepID=A0A9X3F8H1_9BACT|nr:hypothetical protein [Prolixibacteraceae bacterium Z1-6]
MDNRKREERDYLRWDVHYTRAKPKFFTTEKQDLNPFQNTHRPRKDIFLVDWQVCDEEHLK